MKSSIFYTITFIFILSISAISITFLWLVDYDKRNYTDELNAKYSFVSRMALYKMSDLISDEEYKDQTSEFKMDEITQNVDEIIKNSKLIQEISADIGSSAILLYKKHHYLKISHNGEILLLKDTKYQPYRYDILESVFLIVFLVIFIGYVFTIKKLKPLRKLKRQINKFAKGNLNIENVSSGNDEISQVANAFYDAVIQIKNLNQSRQLFLRNIMHELKTPITKGRITVEMIPKSKQQERLIKTFIRLENLINEFASIEKITSGFGIWDIEICDIDKIFNEALDLLISEESGIWINLSENFQISVDRKLFVVAIKNMIDNGLKYSSDKNLEINVDTNSIQFITSGEKLEHDLDFYIQAFSRGKNAKDSFGLGLYIVFNILKIHNLTLKYEFKDKKNIFSFESIKNILTSQIFSANLKLDNV